MAKLNVAERAPRIYTHEGARAIRVSAEDQLRRSVLACMLFEDSFYESGEDIAKRIHDSVAEVLKKPNGADFVGNLAYEARTKFKMRHVPLWLIVALARARTKAARKVVAGALVSCIQRPDEMGEFVAQYWKDGKQPLSAQVKKGLAAAFAKFNEYQLGKYNSSSAAVKLRDVLFLTHAKPVDQEQAELWKKLVEGKLETPDTWEASLSGGADKKGTFARLIAEGKLGALALLRNLRNMQEAGVDDGIIKEALAIMKVERVLPFRFITAARYAPQLEPALESAMFRCLEGQPKLTGKTMLVVDASGSMEGRLSGKSELTRFDAAAAIAILLREICDDAQVIVYSNSPETVPLRRGFALRDAMKAAAEWGGTDTRAAVNLANLLGYDRCIVITDEQSHTAIGNPLKGSLGYFINVATYKNGIGYGAWTHIDGFSEAVVDYIRGYEKQCLEDDDN